MPRNVDLVLKDSDERRGSSARKRRGVKHVEKKRDEGCEQQTYALDPLVNSLLSSRICMLPENISHIRPENHTAILSQKILDKHE